MWVLAMFDLPTDTKKARKDYAQFRAFLVSVGKSNIASTHIQRYPFTNMLAGYSSSVTSGF